MKFSWLDNEPAAAQTRCTAAGTSLTSMSHGKRLKTLELGC
jgi:hypothetical protein